MTVLLRPARSTDAGATGDILHRFATETDWMPKLHSGAEAIAFCGQMIDRGWVTVVETEQGVVGFLARNGAEVHALYLCRASCGQGLGQRLLDDAKSESPRLSLYTFQANQGARRFYERNGFVELERGDGSSNEENLPDIKLGWTRQEATDG
ncbi:GNAT family N-acetyltransferase [Ruegeria sp. HKCCA6707]|uniref:GNAT family N-acetyltransferase n=1 Tax=unclassified Ruegeria TaxID=2625375 RepID=UPI001489CB03